MPKFDLLSLFKKSKPEKHVEYKLKKTNHKYHLVVDDNSINRSVIKQYILSIDDTLTVYEAPNGADCIDIVKKNNNFDYIWIDVKMPIMDGIDATTFLRHNGFENNIIGITGMVDNITKNKCKRAGMNDIIAKPVDIDQIRNYLNR